MAERYLDGRGYLDAFRLRCAIANARRYEAAPGVAVPDGPALGAFDCPHCGAKLAIERPAGLSIQQSTIHWTPDPRVHEGWFGDDPA